MQRRLVFVSIVLFAGLWVIPATATDETGPNLGGRLAQLREEQTRKNPSAKQLILERAQKRKRERVERLKANRNSR